MQASPAPSRFERLQALYSEVDALLSAEGRSLHQAAEGRSLHQAAEGRLNRCGTCNACCTASGATFHHVQAIEYAYLAQVYGEHAARHFRDFAERRLAPDGSFLHDLCPFYDRSAQGCGIYQQRPYACRLFGHFRMQHTRFPDPCVYTDTAREVALGDYYRELPQATALRDLNREHQSRTVVEASGPSTPAVSPTVLEQARAHVDPSNPLDQAVFAHLERRLEDAKSLFEQAVARFPTDGYAHFYRGNLLDDLKASDDAVASYRMAVACEPSNPRFWLHLGFSLLDCQQEQEAAQAFEQVLAHNPDEPLAHGFLGFIALQGGRLEAAVSSLTAANELAPDNPFFSLRLGEALAGLGRVETLERALEAALASPQTEARARALLRRALGS
jgi:cytochrome c-type biogenesis protein CcmH/NrfG